MEELAVTLLPVVTLVLGFFLQQLAGWSEVKAERRSQLNKTIAEVLQAHQEVELYAFTLFPVLQRYNLDHVKEAALSDQLKQTLPRRTKLVSRIDELSDEVAAFDPALALTLRNALVSHETILEWENSSDDSDEAFGNLQAEIRLINSHMRDVKYVALRLARRSGFRVWLNVWRYVHGKRKRVVDQEDARERMDELVARHHPRASQPAATG